MFKYAKIKNEETGLCEVGIGTDVEVYKSIGMMELDVQQSDIDGCWYLTDKCPMKTNKQKAKEERERLNNLRMTKRVLWLQLKELGITYQQLKDLIATNEDAQAEWDLCETLKRDNPLLDIMGAELNITPEQIDEMFKIANGELPEKKGVNNSEENELEKPDDSEVSDDEL